MSQHSKQEVNWEFLLSSSKSTLQAFEMSRLNLASNVRKEIVQLLDAWIDENSNALLARWLIERNLAADAEAICRNAGRSLCELKEHRTPAPVAPQSAPAPSTTTAPNTGASKQAASDKLFGEKSLATPRIHVASQHSGRI